VDENREAWYHYVCEAANQNAYLSNENTSLREQVIDLQEKGTATHAELSEAQSIIRFQQKERDTLSTRAIRAEIERDQALQKATQTILYRERLHLLLPNLPRPPASLRNSLIPTSFLEIAKTSTALLPRSTRS
jgi:hypothetical protein